MEGLDGHDFVLVERNDYDDETGRSLEFVAAIRKWLQPTEYMADSSEYRKHLESRVSGTGHWIENSEKYQQWLGSSSPGPLWIKAPAGMGKSVLAATIASRLAGTEAPVLFFFFQQIVTTNRNPNTLVRDFISQTLLSSPFLQNRMKAYIDEDRSLDSISTNEMWNHLVEALELRPKVYCIVDALDEMDLDKESFITKLMELGSHKPISIKVLMTSRPFPRIESYLRAPSVLHIKLERSLVDKDISTYINQKLRQTKHLSENQRISFQHSLESKTQGSFLYAHLMIDELLHRMKQPMSKISLESLDWLPQSLENMYNMLSDHSARSGVPQELQMAILRWATHSTRHLRLLELTAMLDYVLPTISPNVSSQSSIGRGGTKELVRIACGPLLENFQDESVSVIHHSFAEFLIDQKRKVRPDGVPPQFPVISPVAAHCILATTCLRYLDFLSQWEIQPREMYQELVSHNICRLKDLKMQHPFIDYAMNNWHIHVRKLELLYEGDLLDMQSETEVVSLFNVLDHFMTSKQPALFSAWLDLTWCSSGDSKVLGSTLDVNPLHVAAWAGMTTYARRLINNGSTPHCKDGQYMTPLSWAALKGYDETVTLLSQHDPQLNYDERGAKPLHFTAQANHYKVVKLLFEAGANPLAKASSNRIGPHRRDGPRARNRREACLYYAIRSGSAESLHEMLPYLPIEYLDPALHDAICYEKKEVVEVILTSRDFSIEASGLSKCHVL